MIFAADVPCSKLKYWKSAQLLAQYVGVSDEILNSRLLLRLSVNSMKHPVQSYTAPWSLRTLLAMSNAPDSVEDMFRPGAVSVGLAGAGHDPPVCCTVVVIEIPLPS